MSAWWIVPALVLMAGKGTPKPTAQAGQLVLNRARVMVEPKFWARYTGEVERGQRVTVVKSDGSWVKIVDTHKNTGYVPASTFVDQAVDASQLVFKGSGPDGSAASAAQAANAARGFSREAQQAAVDKAHAQAADVWVDKYEGKDNGAKLVSALATSEPGFITDGHLLGGKP